MTDPQIVRAVVAWSLGFLVLITVGVGVPVIASFVPDAIGYGRRRGDWKPLAGMSGLAVGVIMLAVFQSSYLGVQASPSKVLWGSLTLLLIVASSTAAGGCTISRALKRRAERRVALQAVTQPPQTSSGAASRPQPAAIARLNAREAEYLACDWMHWLGIDDAIVTPEQRDGGVDVRSREFLAQVKHLVNEATGVAAIRQLHGVAAAEGRRTLFFTSSSYTRDAIAFARTVNMALFVVRASEGRLVPQGVIAQQYWLHGAAKADSVNLRRQPVPTGNAAQ